LAQTNLDRLHQSGKLNWPAGSPAPSIDPVECARHFGMNTEGWIAACRASAGIWRVLAYARYDPAQRLEKAHRFDNAIKQLTPGRRAENLQIPGVGIAPLHRISPIRISPSP
jgi:hypothetical protein